MPSPNVDDAADTDPSITLELSLAETNLVLEALGQLPFARVYEVIGRIQAQAQKQLGAGPGTRTGPEEGTTP
jgi:hypothetical protein